MNTLFENLAAGLAQGDIRAIFALVAPVVAIAALASLIYQLRIALWPKTPAQLLEADINEFGSTEYNAQERDARVQVRYRYNVDGESFIGTRVSAWSLTAAGAGKIALEAQIQKLQDQSDLCASYNPARPEKSFLQAPGLFGMILTSIYAIGFASLGWAMAKGLV